VDDLLTEGKTLDEILTMVEENDKSVTVWEAYEYYEPSSLAEAIEDARGVKVHEFMEVLTKVNGKEWADKFQQDPVWDTDENGNHTCVDCMDEVTPDEVLGDRKFGEPRCEGCYDTYKYGA
jgi:hypothetical protein